MLLCCYCHINGKYGFPLCNMYWYIVHIINETVHVCVVHMCASYCWVVDVVMKLVLNFYLTSLFSQMLQVPLAQRYLRKPFEIAGMEFFCSPGKDLSIGTVPLFCMLPIWLNKQQLFQYKRLALSWCPTNNFNFQTTEAYNIRTFQSMF